MRDAKGLAILTVTKAGFIVTGKGGSGLVIARVGKGWSGPSAIGTGGVGFGFQAGAEVSELVIVLNTPEAVNALAKGGNVTLGAGMSIAVGPVGRTAEGSVTLQAAMYTYSRSQGAFAGVSLQGRSSPPGTTPMRNFMVRRYRRATSRRQGNSAARRSCSRFYRSTEVTGSTQFFS